VADGTATRERVSEILNETLKRLGIQAGEYITVSTWLDEWLASKEQVSETTKVSYQQTVREFKVYLGEQGCKRRLESIGEADIRGFVALLRSEGRSATTINKIVRRYSHDPLRAGAQARKDQV
jgi:site-specific recombinase XerC